MNKYPLFKLLVFPIISCLFFVFSQQKCKYIYFLKGGQIAEMKNTSLNIGTPSNSIMITSHASNTVYSISSYVVKKVLQKEKQFAVMLESEDRVSIYLFNLPYLFVQEGEKLSAGMKIGTAEAWENGEYILELAISRGDRELNKREIIAYLDSTACIHN